MLTLLDLTGCGSVPLAVSATPTQTMWPTRTEMPTPTLLPTSTATLTPTPTYTSTAASTSTPTHTPTALPTFTPTPVDPLSPCVTKQFLSLPFDPSLVDHKVFQDGPRRYGIYWFDVDDGSGQRTWWGRNTRTYDGHRGTDIALRPGTAVYAAASGTVFGVSPTGRVDIEHGCGYYTSYHHIDPIVRKGDYILRGQKLGVVNSEPPTPHLHFQMQISGKIEVGVTSYPDSPGRALDTFPDQSNPSAINSWTPNAFRIWLSMPELQ